VAESPWEGELGRSRESYRRRLPQKLDLLEEKLRAARVEPASSGALVAARDLAHRLKGSSGSYGFDEISAVLQRIEDRLDPPLAEEPSRLRPVPWSEIERALGEARTCLRRDANRPPHAP
jgi:HPt (histidine-containing phosphotransfer) domain-containing protein